MTANIAMHLYTAPQACISRDVVREVFMVGESGTVAKREKRWKQLENDVGRNSMHSLRAPTHTHTQLNVLVMVNGLRVQNIIEEEYEVSCSGEPDKDLLITIKVLPVSCYS